MWQEARKQEKKIRGIMIDFKKRAERRQAYYIKMRQDPHQLMRLYGHSFKMFLPDSSSKYTNDKLMPWQGDPEVMIDRFDVRAHLDHIPDVLPPKISSANEEALEAQCNYERYRTLVQIDAAGAAPESYLKQLEIEETFGKKQAEAKYSQKAKSKGNAFGFVYDGNSVAKKSEDNSDNDSDDDDSDLSDIDVNVDVSGLANEQRDELDVVATHYGIIPRAFCGQLLTEKHETDFARRLEQEEEERSKLAGRRGKRARRSLRDRQRLTRMTSPLSFASRSSPTYEPYSAERDGSDQSSSSMSDDDRRDTGQVEFITEFGSASTTTANSTAKASGDSKASNSSRAKKPRHSRDHSSEHTKSSRRSSRDRSRSRERDHHRPREGYHSHSRRSSDEYHRRDSAHRPSRRERSHSRSQSPDRNQRYSSSRRHSSSSSPPHSSRSIPRSSMSSVTRKLESNEKMSKSASSKAATLTPQEKLKLRMQKLLNRQVKEDKKVATKKTVEKEKERGERERDISDGRRTRY